MTISLSILSQNIAAYNQCNKEWKDKAEDRINDISEFLPHGSGIDGKCEIDLIQSKENRIVFFFEYHHMDENGYYCGWTEHNVIVTPKFGGFDIQITGRNKNQCKDYFYDLWYNTFSI